MHSHFSFLHSPLCIMHYALCILLLASCDTAIGTRSSVPTYPVNLELNIKAEYPYFVPSNLNQSLIFTTPRKATDRLGYAGLLLYISMEGKYCAFDLACPNCLSQENPVEVDGMFAICPLCGEQYDLSYGFAYPQKGSQEALRKYSTYYNGDKLLVSQ